MPHQRVILRALLGAIIISVLMPATAYGISREEVLARGKVWVDKNVPYSQSRYAHVDGTLLPNKTKAQQTYAAANGYRTDCSGFVSMCFGLTNSYDATISLTTRSLSPSVLTTITKSALVPGDVMLLKGSHVVLFTGWVDDECDKFSAYEERGTAYGTVKTTRDYSDMTGWGYRPYRYKKIDDFYADCQQAVYGTTSYETAVAASRVSFPATRTGGVDTLVVANNEAWTGNLGAAALAGASGGPLLLSSKTSLPSTATAAIKRLRPARVYIVGGRSSVSTGVAGKIAALGIKVVRVSGSDRYGTAAKAALKTVALSNLESRPVKAAYLVHANAFDVGVAASPIAAKTARPILLTRKASVPAETLDALKRSGIKKVYVLGSTNVISTTVVRTLKKRGISVTRKTGADRYELSRAIARHGVAIPDAGLVWDNVGVASGTKFTGALACGVAQGQAGSLLLLTPGTKLAKGVGAEIAERRTGISRVRVFGGYDTIGLPVRTSIAKIMRAK